MVESEVAAAGIKSPTVLAAMKAVPRHEFVPPDMRQYAYYDMALPIGEHQTISPPFIVAWMTAQLDPQPTDRVLEIGTGSGYQAAILSALVKDVYTIEIVPQLAKRAGATFDRLQYKNVHAKLGDGYQGWAEHAPFDKIIVTCSPEKVPRPLIEQLREGGRLVIPLGERFQQTLYVMTKKDGQLVIQSREPTFFVPMTGQAERQRNIAVDESFTALTNGGFETLLEPDKPAGWYYLRQARIAPDGVSGNCLVLSNQVPGRSAQALQAIGVDGRKVAELMVDLVVRGRDLQPGNQPDQEPKLVVSFFDQQRAPVGHESLGPWTGTFDWRRQSARIKVPADARIAIVALGLMGASGELSCDQVGIRVASPRKAGR